MSEIAVRIDRLAVLGLTEDIDEKLVEKTVQDALGRFAKRLSRSPLSRSGVKELALEALSLDTIAADELLSERGAEQIADALYSALLRSSL